MSGRLRTLLLDFDGVLVPSNRIKDEAFAKLFAGWPEHFDRMMEYHRRNVSLSRVEKFRHFVRECLGRDDPDALDALLAEFSREVTDRIAGAPPVPGSVEFLVDFSGRLPIYLASVTPQPELEAILERRRIRGHFRKIYGDPPVPKAEAVRDVRRLEGCGGGELALVGDSMGDWKAASEGGAEFIGFDSGLPLPGQGPQFRSWVELSVYLKSRLS